MAYSLSLTVQNTPADRDVPALLEKLKNSFPRKENTPYLDALCQGGLPRVTAQRLGALSLLPSLLSEARISTQDLMLKRDEHGRPYFATENGSPVGFDFNLSHTDAHVAAALLVGNGRIGVDIEEFISPSRAIPLIRRYCTEGELSLLGDPADDQISADFFTATWVKREALAKQEGRGMPLRYDTADPPSEIALWSGVLSDTSTHIALCAPRKDAPAHPTVLANSLPIQLV